MAAPNRIGAHPYILLHFPSHLKHNSALLFSRRGRHKRVVFFTILLALSCRSGWLAETTRPHGYAISETQFVVFILNASRRLFSDRFFTSSFRPGFYTTLGLDWVKNNGPGPVQMEESANNGHRQQVSPLKRVLLCTVPELAPELEQVVNA